MSQSPDSQIAHKPSLKQSILALLGFLSIVAVASALGAAATYPHIGGWYAALNKPAFTPPNGVFAPVWTTLFVLMAIAAWLVWQKRGLFGAQWALMLWGVQLVLNVTWSVLFFGIQRPDWALAEIGVLWLVILATLIAFWHIRPLAGLLLVPYVAWVSYAVLLNIGILRLNG